MKKVFIWVLKSFLGYAAIATPTFAILYWALRLSVRQLLPPYILLFGVTALGVLMTFDARRYIAHPMSFRVRTSATVFIFLLAGLTVVYYFGNEYGFISPEYSAMLIWTGLIGVGMVSVYMFFYLRRWIHLRNPEK